MRKLVASTLRRQSSEDGRLWSRHAPLDATAARAQLRGIAAGKRVPPRGNRESGDLREKPKGLPITALLAAANRRWSRAPPLTSHRHGRRRALANVRFVYSCTQVLFTRMEKL